MDIVVLLVFVSLVLVVAALVFFVTRLRGGDFDHGDRLSLLPLSDDDGAGSGESRTVETDSARTDDEPDTKEDDDTDASR